ncbi:MAG: metallophosphoesterase [Candidatus Riflebacteria bacterium]|nr:metallophosphoesterase [Candidatus Riflebacteria bacterium]
MRLRIYSDLHLETRSFSPPPGSYDVVVLAGDVHEGTEGVRWARTAFPETPVVYVPGNHEHYGQTLPEVAPRLREAALGSSVYVLERQACVVEGVRFLGCTLWSDFDLLHDRGRSSREAAARGLDYRAIKSADGRRFLPADAARAHKEAAAESVPPDYLVRPRAAAYASHLDPLVELSGADLWIHGHVHRRCDYWIGDTRVICNPRGVGDESVDDFDPLFTIDVG